MTTLKNNTNTLLKVTNLCVCYGKICSLENINLEVIEGTTLSVVGPNGAGKSSLLNAIAGLVPLKSGKIVYRGNDISHYPTYRKSRAGLVLVPEGRQLFTKLTVEENITCGHISHPKKSLSKTIKKIYELFPLLEERKKQLAGHLSGGEQQMVAIGRAIANNPKLLMLDEPSMGLSPPIVKKIFEAIDSISKQGTTIVLVEQNINLAIHHSHKTIVLEGGKIQAEVNSHDIKDSPYIKSKYLGIAP
ncbi:MULTISPECIES: ABC transporter ATP-binding protein [Candidatus Ichthyocystis]|uniref:Branched-chain amino acid transporter ATP-binding subunit n=1 Tax=Candidatus Ichthyocystis hellenicum TaxID=1561003 RepID=A0A0S4M5V3_9BURK|nr:MULTISPECIES: ABC transporter ATP-binding protein [Ichthyocystis]CUT17512.1 branched-chain amino acid transporter ATP-binding subunit [Candidatus Ichthyocystis hellenicum]